MEKMKILRPPSAQIHFVNSLVLFAISLAKIIFIAAAIAIAVTPNSALAFGLNDVSVLLPLPQNEEDLGEMLAPGDQDLIPEDVLTKLPPLIMNEQDPDLRRSQLRVLGIRFDPCFSEGEAPFSCRHQIRLVFQPVSWFNGRSMTIDAAVHAFYDFDDAHWLQVVQEWKKLATDLPGSLLQIHPLIRQEGLRGAHWQVLKTLLLRYCKPEQLTRVTAMSVNTFGAAWVFRGFDRDMNGDLKPITIAQVPTSTTQAFFVDLSDLQEFRAQTSPAPNNEAPWTDFMKNSPKARQSLTRDQLTDVMVRAVEFENPNRFNPGNRDCVSCHVAQTVRLWGEHNLTGALQDPRVVAARFASPFPLENRSLYPFNANRLRAFGYFLDEPVISQRVINETAKVAEQMLTGL